MSFIEKDNKIYAIIIADGTIRIPAREDDPEAVKREFELSTGEKRIKYEYVKKGIKGTITSISLKDTDFGKMLNISFNPKDFDGQNIVLSMSTSSNFGGDFMEKLPNIDLLKEVSLSPYSFLNEKQKPVKGITVWQTKEGEEKASKITSYFKGGEDGKKAINGFPPVEFETKGASKDKWKMYFLTVKMFLEEYTEKNVINKLFEASIQALADGSDSPKDEIDVENIPFD